MYNKIQLNRYGVGSKDDFKILKLTQFKWEKMQRKSHSKLIKIMNLLRDLNTLSPDFNKSLRLFNPIHLDVSLRMYHLGETNFIVNK